MNKNKLKFLLFLFLIVFLSAFSQTQAKENIRNFPKFDLSVDYSLLYTSNAAILSSDDEPQYITPGGLEIKLTLPLKNNFKFSFGTGAFSQSWSKYVSGGFFGSSAHSEFFSLSATNVLLEVFYSFNAHVNPYDEVNVGLRLDYINLQKIARKQYDDITYASNNRSLDFSGRGYKISLPIELKKRIGIWIFYLSYAPGIWNIPVSGSINGTSSIPHFADFVSTFAFGINLRNF